MNMDRSEFAKLLRTSIFEAWRRFIAEHADETPYAFALLADPCARYLGFAIATEERLKDVAATYEQKGYRYHGEATDVFDNREKLATWLRWSNPDDGWHVGVFSERHPIQLRLTELANAGAFGEDAAELEPFCTDVLARIASDAKWRWNEQVVVGFTYGEDPRDFLRTATRANPYRLVQRLWSEYRLGQELSRSIYSS